MDPIDILQGEHDIIKNVLSYFDKLLSECRRENKIARQNLLRIVQFFDYYVYQNHEIKEEEHLFPILESMGLDEDKSMIGDLIRDHKDVKNKVLKISGLLSHADSENPEVLNQLIDAGRSVILLKRRHIRNENHYLYPLADIALNENDVKTLSESFQKVAEMFPANMNQENAENFDALVREIYHKI